MKRILGIVLSGGESRRFGTDKALAVADDRPLIVHAIERLAPHAESVILCGRSYAGVAHIPDRPVLGLGPLGGLNAGIHHALMAGYSHVLSVACDTPRVPRSALALLTKRDRACVIADHPVIGIWPTDLGPRLDDFLARTDRRSMRAWMRCCGANAIAVAGIANINRPEDLDLWLSAKSITDETEA